MRHFRLRHCSIALSAIAITGIAHAFPTSRLQYSRGAGTEDCPAESAVRDAVAARLGYDPFVDSASRIIVARIERSDDRLVAQVELFDQFGARQGSRRFSTDTARCDELISAVALSISIAVDPERAQSREAAPVSAPAQAPESEAEEPGPSAALVKKRVRPAPLRTQDPSIDRGLPAAPKNGSDQHELAWYSGAGAFAAAGSGPAPTGGAFAFFGVRRQSAALSLEGRADAPASGSVNGDARVTSSLLVATLAPCWQPTELFACALASLGTLRGSGSQIAYPRDDAAFYAAAGARLGAELPLYEPLWVRFHLDLLGTLARVALQIDEQTVWKAPAFSSAFGLGLKAHFP